MRKEDTKKTEGNMKHDDVLFFVLMKRPKNVHIVCILEPRYNNKIKLRGHQVITKIEKKGFCQIFNFFLQDFLSLKGASLFG